MSKSFSLPFPRLVEACRWRYDNYIRPYRDVYRSPSQIASRAIRNFRASSNDPAIAYICSDTANAGDYASHLGLISLTGREGVQLFCAPVTAAGTLSTLRRRLESGRSWGAVFIGGGGLLQHCFDDFWRGLLTLDVPLVLFGVGAAQSGTIRPVTDSRLLSALGQRATAIHVRDEFTRDLLLKHGAKRVTVGICPSVNYLLPSRNKVSTATHLLHAIHEADLRIAGVEPDAVRSVLRRIAQTSGLEYDEVSHRSGFSSKLLERYHRAAFVVSSRLHGCIFSYALGKPFVPIVCDRKTDAFVERYAPDATRLSPKLLCANPDAVHTAANRPVGSRVEREARLNVDVMSGILAALKMDISVNSRGPSAPMRTDRAVGFD